MLKVSSLHCLRLDSSYRPVCVKLNTIFITNSEDMIIKYKVTLTSLTKI